jgi:hypothetical protein
MPLLTPTERRPVVVFAWIAFLLMVLSGFLPADTHAAEKYQHLVNCDLHNGACSQRLQDTDVRLEVTPRPVKAMTDLLFKVTLSGSFTAPQSAPYIDLGMPGMNMGPNRVLLKSTGPASFEGQGVIVRCPSGRKIWQATVTLPELGAARFVFHVIY